MIDKILTEAGFATGPDAITSLTNALAGRKPDAPATEHPAPDSAATSPAAQAAPVKVTLGPKKPAG